MSSKSRTVWEEAEHILRGKEEPKKSIVLGIFLIIVGAGILDVGNVLHDGLTQLVGVLLLLGGIILFFEGIDAYLKRVR